MIYPSARMEAAAPRAPTEGIVGEWLPTAAEAVSAYLQDAEIEGRPRGSIATYRSSLSLIRDSCEPVAALAVSLRGLLYARLRTVSPNSASGIIAAHRAFVRYCQARGWLVSDPLAGLKPPRKHEVPHRYLTPADVQRLWAAIDAPLDRAALCLLAMGLRAGEACAVRWTDIDWEAATLTVRTEKHGEPRELPLDTRALDALRAAERRAPTVLGITRHRLWTRMTRLGRRAGVPFHPHMLRHAWAMAWLEATGDQGTLQTLGGWRTAGMPRYYARSALRRVALARAREAGLSARLFEGPAGLTATASACPPAPRGTAVPP